MGSGAIYLPILGILAGALLMLRVLPPWDLIREVSHLIPELVGQRTLVHIDRNDIGLGASILHSGRIGHGVGEVHRLAATWCQGFNAVCGNDRSQLRHVRAAGHGDGNGIGAVVHRTGHAVDGEGCDARGGRRCSLPLTTDAHITLRHGKAVVGDLHRFATFLSQRVGQRIRRTSCCLWEL